VKTIDIAEAVQPLAEYAERAGEETVVVTIRGRPVAVVLPVDNADQETISLSTNPKFLALIERSRSRLAEEGGLTEDEVRRRLGVPVGGVRNTEDTKHTKETRKRHRR
jgi:prevent-host-death family protein